MLLNKDIDGLQDNIFDDSYDEHDIFKEVFFGNDGSKSNKKCVVTGVINFETDHCKNTIDDNSPQTNQDRFSTLSSKRMKLSDSIYQHPVTCRLVESSRNGVKSSSYLLKRQVGDNFKPRWKDSCFVELNITEMEVPQNSKNDPRPLLRYHIHRLLRGAGWVIGKRKRAKYSTVTGEYVYRSPAGRPIREFRRAWILCGQSLFAYDEDLVIDSNSDCNEWTELTHFCADLSNSLSNINEQFGKNVTTSTLAHCWYILDPYANVVFIDKAMGLLREGKLVKARRSFVIESVLALKNVDIPVSDQDHGTREEHCGSDITCDQTCTSLYEVPITFENLNVNLKLTNCTQLSTYCESDSELFEVPIYVMDDVSFDVMLKSSYKKSKKMFGKTNRQFSPVTWRLKDGDLLSSATIKNKKLKSPTNRVLRKSRKRRTQRGRCRLLPRNLDRGESPCLETKLCISTNRTMLSWLINSGFIALNEAIECRNPEDDASVKYGIVTSDGVLCKCCNSVLSVSQFKIHAGNISNRLPSDVFLQSGKSMTLCQLEAWSAEFKSRKSTLRALEIELLDQNDDSCGLCGDGGELICCDNCPSTFHQSCMYTEELPEGSWYCSYCTCGICGDLVTNEDSSQSPIALKCLQCERKYHESCHRVLEGVGGFQSDAISNSWFCTSGCQEIYSGVKTRIGIMNSMHDGFGWTVLKCFHNEKMDQQFMALKAECNLKLSVGLTIMEECFLPMVDPRTGIDMIPHVLYNLGSEFPRLNYHGFRTVVLEKDDVLMSVASIRIHGVKFAEMPLIATCANYRRQGMCRRLMNGIEEMLTSLKVETLVISAIPELVETWKEGFGFEPLEENDKIALSTINLMVFPGSIWMKKQFKGYPTITSEGNTRDYEETEKEIKIRNSQEPMKMSEESVSTFEVGSNLSDIVMCSDGRSKPPLSQNSSESCVFQGK